MNLLSSLKLTRGKQITTCSCSCPQKCNVCYVLFSRHPLSAYGLRMQMMTTCFPGKEIVIKFSSLALSHFMTQQTAPVDTMFLKKTTIASFMKTSYQLLTQQRQALAMIVYLIVIIIRLLLLMYFVPVFVFYIIMFIVVSTMKRISYALSVLQCFNPLNQMPTSVVGE